MNKHEILGAKQGVIGRGSNLVVGEFLQNLENNMSVDSHKISEDERKTNIGYCYFKNEVTGEYDVMLMNKDAEALKQLMEGLHETLDKYPYTGAMLEIHKLIKELDIWVGTSLKVGREKDNEH